LLWVAVQRAGLPYADLQSSEAPLFVQLQRMASGGPPYLPTYDANSWVFGPLYLYVLAPWNALVGGHDNVVSARLLSMVLGLCGLVPLSLSAVLIARRIAGRLAMRSTAQIAAVLCAALGLAVLTRRMNFGTLHPDDLVFTVVATMLLCYNAASASARNGRFIVLLAIAGVAACFGEEQMGALAPLLFLGLALSRSITLRTLTLLLAAYACALFVCLLAIGNDARAWAFLVPLAQHWEALGQTCAATAFSTCVPPYLRLLFCAAALALVFIWRREHARTLATDALPFLAIVATAGAGSFSRDSLRNSLFLAGLACVPYFAATVAALTAPPVLAGRRRAARWLTPFAAALVIATIFGLNVRPMHVPGALVTSTLDGARTRAVALCARRQRIVVMALPDLFRDCREATYEVSASYVQLLLAFPGYNAGPTVFDLQQHATYIVTVAGVLLPASWASDYRLDGTAPAFAGHDGRFFPAALQVYKHR
jgi:hypothetical protein